MVKKFDRAFFDLDGTIYVDGILLDGTLDELHALNALGTKIYYMTNNTSVSIATYNQKVKKLGLPYEQGCVLSPALPLANWMISKKISSFYCVGTDDFIASLCEMTGAQHTIKAPDVVIATFDKELTYQKLEIACAHINSGVAWVQTHFDKNCPTANGPMPDCGVISSLIELTTNISPTDNFGKPHDHMQDYIKRLVSPDEQLLVSGDRIYTDAAIGLALGATTVLVETGEFCTTPHQNDVSDSNIIIAPSLAVYLREQRLQSRS